MGQAVRLIANSLVELASTSEPLPLAANDNNAVHLIYDANGNPPSLYELRRTGRTKLTWPGGTVYDVVYSYDNLNRMTEAEDSLSTVLAQYAYDPYSRRTSLTYDANGNILARTTRAGCVLSYSYDVLNRKLTDGWLSACSGVGANSVTTAYDLGGRVTAWSNTPGDSQTPTYDTAGRMTEMVTSTSGMTGTLPVKYTLDANGNRTKLTWPGGTAYDVVYSYDNLNRMTEAEDSLSTVLAQYGYDTYSRRTSLTYPNSAGTTYSYTPGNDLLTLDHSFVTSSNDVNYTLGYTNAHQLQSETVSCTSNNCEYEPSTTAATSTYGTGVAGGNVNTLNEYPTITPAGGSNTTLTYDLNGNLTYDGSFTYTYDPENRLLTANNGTTSASYAYDPLGRRESKTVNGTATYYLNDGSDILSEHQSNKTVLRRYIPGPAINEPIAYENCAGATTPNCTGSGPVDEYFHTDHHGSVLTMSASSGNPASDANSGNPVTYDAYGNTLASLSGEPFHYVGMYYDAETGLYFDRARYYSPLLARFMQDDPLLYKDDLDLYTYVGNDPTDMTDPTGKFTCTSNRNGTSTCTATGVVDSVEMQIYVFFNNAIVTIMNGNKGSQSSGNGNSGDKKQDSGNQGAVPAHVGPGPNAQKPIPAGPSPTPTKEQQGQINQEGDTHGCHTCGTNNPGTASGNWVGDHQPPTALNPPGGPQVYYPQCVSCSNKQGGAVRGIQRGNGEQSGSSGPDAIVPDESQPPEPPQ
jgi:RHS repeat-associated protein